LHVRSITEALSQSLGKEVTFLGQEKITGGCINTCFKIRTNRGDFLMKFNNRQSFDLLKKEVIGLKLLKQAKQIYIPEIYNYGLTDEYSYILMEFVNQKDANTDFWQIFGQQLSEMHKYTNEKFGLDHDNYIGSLKQFNQKNDNWVNFYETERLKRQVEILPAILKTEIEEKIAKLYPKLDDLVPKYPPALLHGDLWHGNFLVNLNNEPTLIDPATHFGNPEYEIAFTLLFGGFDKKFYQAYFENYNFENGFEERKEVYWLYFMLVHLNIFGVSYLSATLNCLNKYI